MNVPRMSSDLEKLLKRKGITLVPHDAGSSPQDPIPVILMYRSSDMGAPIGQVAATAGGAMWLPFFNYKKLSSALPFDAAVRAVLAHA